MSFREFRECPQATGRVGCDRTQKLGKLVSGSGIEATIGTVRQPSDLAKSTLRNGIITFLKQKGGNAEQSERSRRMAKIVKVLLHGIAHKHQGLDLRLLRLSLRMRDDLADLGMTSPAFDPLHQCGEALGPRYPEGCAAFSETTVVDQLDIEAADGRRFAKHVCLQPACGVPQRLPAHGRIERKD